MRQIDFPLNLGGDSRRCQALRCSFWCAQAVDILWPKIYNGQGLQEKQKFLCGGMS
jgi:hypothetical protein